MSYSSKFLAWYHFLICYLDTRRKPRLCFAHYGTRFDTGKKFNTHTIYKILNTQWKCLQAGLLSVSKTCIHLADKFLLGVFSGFVKK